MRVLPFHSVCSSFTPAKSFGLFAYSTRRKCVATRQSPTHSNPTVIHSILFSYFYFRKKKDREMSFFFFFIFLKFPFSCPYSSLEIEGPDGRIYPPVYIADCTTVTRWTGLRFLDSVLSLFMYNVVYKSSVRPLHSDDDTKKEGSFFSCEFAYILFILHQCRTSDWKLLADEMKIRGKRIYSNKSLSLLFFPFFFAIVDQRSIR